MRIVQRFEAEINLKKTDGVHWNGHDLSEGCCDKIPSAWNVSSNHLLAAPTPSLSYPKNRYGFGYRRN